MTAEQPGVMANRQRVDAERSRLAAIVESSNDAIIGKSLDGVISDWNPAAERLYGYRADEMIGRSIDLIAPPECPDERRQLLQRVRRGERIAQYETVGIRKDGTRVDVALSFSPIRDEHGTVVGAACIERDITERRALERALRDSEARFRATFEQAAVGMAHVGLDGRWLRANRRLATIVGYTPEELLERRFQDITHPDDVEADLALLRRTLAGEIETYQLDKRYIRKDGGVVWVALTVSLLRDARGRPDYFIAVVEDIGARKRAERAMHIFARDLERGIAERTADLARALADLRASEAFFQSLVESIPQAVFRKDAQGRYTFGNRVFCALLGVAPADVDGKTDRDFYPPDLAAKYRADDERVLAAGEPLDTVEPYRAPGAAPAYVRTIKTPVRDATGVMIGVQGIFWDVTQEQQTAQLHREADQLAAVARRVAASLDLGETLDAVAQAGLELIGADSCALALPGADGRLSYRTIRGAAAETVRQYRFEPGDGFVGRAFAQGRPQRADDLLASAESHRPDLDSASGLRSFLALPLRAGERVLGVLVAASHRPGAFDARAEALLERLADQAAVALEHASLYERARAQVVERERAEASARTLFGAALSMSGATDLPARLDRLLESASALLRADFAEVLLLDAQHGTLELVAASGSLWLPTGHRMPTDRSLAGLVLRGNRPLRSADMTLDPRTWEPDAAREAGMRAWMGVPLTDREGAFGVLGVGARVPGAFREEDERGLTALAALAGAAIREARHHDRERAARAEAEALAESRALYEAAAINLADGLVIVAADDRVLFYNRRIEALLGIDRADALGRDINDLTAAVHARSANPPETRRLAREARDAALAGTPAAFEYHLDGDPPRDLQTLVFRIDGPSGLLGHGRLVRDVTREREVDRMKSEFVSLVSHELRTPLTSIVGYVELLRSEEAGDLSAEQREFLEVVGRNAARLTALINDFLDISRIESGKVALRRERLDLAALVQRAAEELRQQSERKRQTLTVEIAAPLPAVWGDPERIAQVLDNLLSNAHKYTPAGGAISVRVAPEPGAVRLEVRDTGVGLTAAEQGKLFTRFFRAENRATREAGGTGLGLAITRALVEQHGGTIGVESAPGAGSTFSVRLPIRAERDTP